MLFANPRKMLLIKVFSSPSRVRILKYLGERRFTASELSKLLNLSVPTVLYHLSLLERAGLVRKIPSGSKWIYYELTESGQNFLRNGVVKILAVLLVLIFLLMKHDTAEKAKPLGGGLGLADIALLTVVLIFMICLAVVLLHKLLAKSSSP